MEGQKISIDLTVSEWNVVMQALGNMPFAQVANIVPVIQSQAKSALDAINTPTE